MGHESSIYTGRRTAHALPFHYPSNDNPRRGFKRNLYTNTNHIAYRNTNAHDNIRCNRNAYANTHSITHRNANAHTNARDNTNIIPHTSAHAHTHRIANTINIERAKI